jgi:diacylglycerol kinase family enzyme
VPSLQFTTPDGQEIDHAAVLLVSNNAYVWSGPPDFGRRARMDQGELGALALVSVPPGKDVMNLALSDLAGRQEWTAPGVIVDSDDASIPAGLDGEAVQLDAPVDLRNVPGGLRLLVPAGARPGYVAPSQQAVERLLDIAGLSEADDV